MALAHIFLRDMSGETAAEGRMLEPQGDLRTR